MRKYDICAIDAGQGNLRFCVAEGGQAVFSGETRCGVTNILMAGSEGNLRKNLGIMMDKVHKALGPTSFRVVSIGSTGVSRGRREYDVLLGLYRRFFKKSEVLLESDIIATHFANFGEECGITLHAGTGAFAFGRDKAGKSFQTGGWGYLLGDQGAGFGLGLVSLQAAIQAMEGTGPESALAKEILSFYSIGGISELRTLIYSGSDARSYIASFSKVLFAKAREGDQVSQRIVNNGVKEMANLVKPLLERLLFDKVNIALTGALYSRVPEYFAKTRRLLAEMVGRRTLGSITLGEKSSLDGALSLAIRASQRNGTTA